jgi:DNA polymerase sigma
MKKMFVFIVFLFTFSMMQTLIYADNLTTRTVEGKYKIIYGKSPVPPESTKNTKPETIENNPYETSSQENPKNTEEMVYVTKSGKKYHHKGCSYLRSIGGSFTVEEAQTKGYKPCRRF